MDSNGDRLRMQLELLNKATDPVENNPSTEFNSTTNTNNISTGMNSNNPADNTFYYGGQASVFSHAPVNMTITSNVAPAMMPTLIPVATPYTATYYNDIFPPPPQNSVMWSSPPSENPAAWSNPWIQIPPNMSNPPMQNNPAMLPSPTVEQSPPPNWDAISAYLRGQVRPSTDVERVFRCNVCRSEFPNAQALGGHKGMHRKRDEGSSSKPGSSKKTRRR